MDYYTKYLHGLADDIAADMKGCIVFIDLGGSALYLPNTNNDGFEAYLSNLGIRFEKCYIHTYKVVDYPDNFKFTEEMAKKMAKELWGLEPAK